MPKNHVYATAYNKLPVKTAVTRKNCSRTIFTVREPKKFALQIAKKKKLKSKGKTEKQARKNWSQTAMFASWHFISNSI